VRKLSLQQKLITRCHPDFETVICWPDRSGTLVPLGSALTPGVPFEDITYPCKRPTPAGSWRGPRPASSHDGATAFDAKGTGRRTFVWPPVPEEGRGTGGSCFEVRAGTPKNRSGRNDDFNEPHSAARYRAAGPTARESTAATSTDPQSTPLMMTVLGMWSILASST